MGSGRARARTTDRRADRRDHAPNQADRSDDQTTPCRAAGLLVAGKWIFIGRNYTHLDARPRAGARQHNRLAHGGLLPRLPRRWAAGPALAGEVAWISR